MCLRENHNLAKYCLICFVFRCSSHCIVNLLKALLLCNCKSVYSSANGFYELLLLLLLHFSTAITSPKVQNCKVRSHYMKKQDVDLQAPASIGQLHWSEVPYHLFLPSISQRDLCYMACDQKTCAGKTESHSSSNWRNTKSSWRRTFLYLGAGREVLHSPQPSGRPRLGGGCKSSYLWELLPQLSGLLESPIQTYSVEKIQLLLW